MKNKDLIQLSSLKKNELFRDIFKRLCLNSKDLSDSDKEFILTCSIIFFKVYDNDKRYKSYFKIGYYIILKYSITFNDFKPLYDLSLQIGFYPISNFLIKNSFVKLEEKDFADYFLNEHIVKNYSSNEKYIESLEQNRSVKSILNNNSSSIAYIAPTSYGKSSIIKEFLKQNNFQKIGIIVPTKSLLVQTYNEIKALNLDYKLILHDEMFQNETKFIGILTQERATRIITKNNVFYDILFIDEAHKIFNRDSRSIILSRLIQLNYSKNENHRIIYLSPLVENTDNLKVKNGNKNEDVIFTKSINYDLKANDIFLFDSLNCYQYNKFTDEYYDLVINTTFFQYIIDNSQDKNFIYHFRPKKIQELSLELYKYAPSVVSSKIQKLIQTLNDEVHPSFYVVELLEKGIIYIHAKIPNLIKEFLEFQFKEIQEIKFIIANQVILEGINLPIDTLFITSTSGNKMKGKELTNLIGRVNRLNYVFNKTNLNSLISKIHFLNNENFQGKRDIRKTMSLLRSHTFEDDIENPLIENYNIENLKKKIDDNRKRKLEHEDKIIVESSDFLLKNPIEQIDILKKYLIENTIDNFYGDLEKSVEAIQNNIDNFRFSESIKIVDIIVSIFIENCIEYITDYELERLKNVSAINYYNYFLEVTQNQSLKEKINSTLRYFKEKAKSSDPFLYIGETYGEQTRTSEKYTSERYKRPVYVNLNKSEKDLVNLSIVKLKIEEDFVSFKLNKLITFLYEFKLIDEDYYYAQIYGTTDKRLINLIRFGLNLHLIKKLENDGQVSNIYLDINGNVRANDAFFDYCESQSELFQFEIRKYISR